MALPPPMPILRRPPVFFDAGVALRNAILSDDAFNCRFGMKGVAIFPVATSVSQKLPFITFYRSGIEIEPVKSVRGPITAYFQFQIYSEDWSEGNEIAGYVVDILDGYTDTNTIRECKCVDAQENMDPTVPAYMQILTFKVKTR